MRPDHRKHRKHKITSWSHHRRAALVGLVLTTGLSVSAWASPVCDTFVPASVAPQLKFSEQGGICFIDNQGPLLRLTGIDPASAKLIAHAEAGKIVVVNSANGDVAAFVEGSFFDAPSVLTDAQIAQIGRAMAVCGVGALTNLGVRFLLDQAGYGCPTLVKIAMATCGPAAVTDSGVSCAASVSGAAVVCGMQVSILWEAVRSCYREVGLGDMEGMKITQLFDTAGEIFTTVSGLLKKVEKIHDENVAVAALPK